MRPRFLLDEHVNQAIQRQLRRLDIHIEVLVVGDAEAPATGMSDPDILVWIVENSYILFTENRNTIPTHLVITLLPVGIFLVSFGFVQALALDVSSRNCT